MSHERALALRADRKAQPARAAEVLNRFAPLIPPLPTQRAPQDQ